MKKSFLTLISLIVSMGSLSASANGIDREARYGRDYRRQPPPVYQMCPTGRMGYTIEMNDSLFDQRNNVIPLKQELARAYPRLDLRSSNLLSVCLMAKSQHGRGSAELIVGPGTQDIKNVSGTPQGFDNSRDRTFEEVELRNFRGNDNGVWQVHFTGRIKVRRVVVQLDERRRPPVGMKYFDYDAGRFEKNKSERKTIRINLDRVEEISLIGADKTLDIYSVYVNFKNGTRRYLPSLEGQLVKREIKTEYLDQRNVESLIVEARSVEPFVGRAKLSIRIGYR